MCILLVTLKIYKVIYFRPRQERVERMAVMVHCVTLLTLATVTLAMGDRWAWAGARAAKHIADKPGELLGKIFKFFFTNMNNFRGKC